MNGAMLVARMLRAYQVEYVFGVPGDTNVPLYGALAQLRNSIQHVLARDERSAGYMADAYARVSNKPGIVEVPSGAGAMYVLPAVAEAHGSCVPMIVLTSDTPLSGEGRGVITELDCARLFEPITKGSFLVKSAAKLPETLRRAFRLATTGRPGAVHLAIPEDVLHDKVDPNTVSLHAEPACCTFPAYPARAAQQDIAELLKIASRAQRPLVVVGGGVNRSGGGAELTAFVERYRLPVVTTITGQNAIVDTHELSIGIVGDNGFHPHANRALEEADLLIYFGCRNGSVVSIGWTFPAPRAERKVIQVDIDPAVLGNNSENLLSIHSDARLALQDLLAHPRVSDWATDPTWVDALNAWRRTFWSKAAAPLGEPSKQPLRPQYVIEALSRHMRQPHLLFADPGTPTPYLGRFLRLPDRDSQLFIPRAFGGLGYAIPAVVGGWYARPHVRPIGLFGDGSMGMCAGELETLARLRVPAILINFNNACFGWIKALQRLHGPHDFMSVDFTAQDYGAIARDFGLHALRVESESELDAALAQAFRHDGPVLLDVLVESIAEQLPPVYNWLRQTGIDPLTVDGRQLGLQATSNLEKIA
jgi:acetolactate synthase I/II/III large subunit